MDKTDMDDVVDYLKSRGSQTLELMNAFYIASEEYETNFRLLPNDTSEEAYICRRMLEMLDKASDTQDKC